LIDYIESINPSSIWHNIATSFCSNTSSYIYLGENLVNSRKNWFTFLQGATSILIVEDSRRQCWPMSQSTSQLQQCRIRSPESLQQKFLQVKISEKLLRDSI